MWYMTGVLLSVCGGVRVWIFMFKFTAFWKNVVFVWCSFSRWTEFIIYSDNEATAFQNEWYHLFWHHNTGIEREIQVLQLEVGD